VYSKLFSTSEPLNLSIFDKTIIIGKSKSKIYLYISKSVCCGQSFESTNITTFLIDLFLSSKYQDINQSKLSFKSFHSFANQYPGKSVK
jgi:hypothetical protein